MSYQELFQKVFSQFKKNSKLIFTSSVLVLVLILLVFLKLNNSNLTMEKILKLTPNEAREILNERDIDIDAKTFYEMGYNGNLEVVGLFLALDYASPIKLNEEHIIVDEAKTNGTPLIRASIWGHVDIVKLLLDKGSNVNLSDINGETPLMLASKEGHTDVVKLLLDNGANVNAKSKHYANSWYGKRAYDATALMLASENGHADVVKLLLDKGADVNTIDGVGYTPLQHAISRYVLKNITPTEINTKDKNNLIETIKKLLEGKGVNVDLNIHDFSSVNGSTILMVALENRLPLEIIKDLIKKSTNINLIRKDSFALLEAIKENYPPEIIKAIIDKGDASMTAVMKGECLYYVVIKEPRDHEKYNNADIFKILMDNRFDEGINYIFFGETPLIAASNAGNIEFVKQLLDKNAIIDGEKTEKQALIVASEKGHIDIVKLLLERGANVNAQTIDKYGSGGKTALMLASKEGHTDVVKLLLDKGADKTLKDNNGETAVDQVAGLEILKLLKNE